MSSRDLLAAAVRLSAHPARRNRRGPIAATSRQRLLSAVGELLGRRAAARLRRAVDRRHQLQDRSIPGFEAAGGVRVWRGPRGRRRRLVVLEERPTAAVSAQVPHPFFFGQPAPGFRRRLGLVARRDRACTCSCRGRAPLRDRWQLAIAGGPSWFIGRPGSGQRRHDHADLSRTTPRRSPARRRCTARARAAGFNAGVDVAYLLRPHVGVGVGVTFSHASVAARLIPLTVDAGGAHVNAGLRFRF